MTFLDMLRGAERHNPLLGVTGMVARTRLLGVFMICIGVEFITHNVRHALAVGDRFQVAYETFEAEMKAPVLEDYALSA